MFALLLLAAEEGAEPSKTPFYIFAAALVAFAVILAVVGTARHETFPPTKALQRVLMLVGAVLVAGTMVTAVVTA
ncbi:MAG TPA: hypothetical protein VNS09_14980 [Solirubrobacter sp.]|nr:hypothetical protein [Solirubrobacter sp.]